MAGLKFNVAMTDSQIFPVTVEREILAKAGADVSEAACRSEGEVLRLAQDADGILNVQAKIPRGVIEKLTKCKVIARYGIGYDTVDLAAATERGICVCNVPAFCVDEVADTTLSLILATTRKLIFAVDMVRGQNWARQPLRPIHRLRGQTLGLIAFGMIGRAVCERAKTFGLNVIAYDPYVDKSLAQRYGVELVSLDDLLRRSDVVSIHTPLSQETRHLIGEAELRKMKKTAHLINTARGPVVDGKALHKAVSEGWIAGAGLDVMEKEPPDWDDPLLKLPSVVVVPHYAGYTEESYHEVRVRAADQVAQVLRGEFPKHLVNPEVREKLKGRLK